MRRSRNTVGAYEAKTHLSELLEKVEAGEEIVITRHGAAEVSHQMDPGGLFAGYAARPSSRRARWLVRPRSSGFPFQ